MPYDYDVSGPATELAKTTGSRATVARLGLADHEKTTAQLAYILQAVDNALTGETGCVRSMQLVGRHIAGTDDFNTEVLADALSRCATTVQISHEKTWDAYLAVHRLLGTLKKAGREQSPLPGNAVLRAAAQTEQEARHAASGLIRHCVKTSDDHVTALTDLGYAMESLEQALTNQAIWVEGTARDMVRLVVGPTVQRALNGTGVMAAELLNAAALHTRRARRRVQDMAQYRYHETAARA